MPAIKVLRIRDVDSPTGADPEGGNKASAVSPRAAKVTPQLTTGDLSSGGLIAEVGGLAVLNMFLVLLVVFVGARVSVHYPKGHTWAG